MINYKRAWFSTMKGVGLFVRRCLDYRKHEWGLQPLNGGYRVWWIKKSA